MKKEKTISKCFTCGEDLSKLTPDKLNDHMLIHKRDEIVAEYPILIEIDKEIGEKYSAEIKIMFQQKLGEK